MTVSIASLHDEPSPLPNAGLGALVTDNGNLPLDEVDVRASIAGTVAGIELAQGFRNTFDVPLEATYIFPLPDRGAVTAMRMETADRVVEGVLKERGQARADYDAAIAQGQRAAIAEEDRSDVFTMRVGNILPGERVTVRLRLSQPLPYEDGEITFRFPFVVAPRYIPGTPIEQAAAGDGVESDTDAVPDASRISPPVLLPGFPNPVRLAVRVDVDPAGLPLRQLASSLHVVAEETGAGGRTTVRLQPGERLNRDFVLRLGIAEHAQAAVALTLVPDAAPSEQEGAAAQPRAAAKEQAGTFALTVLPPSGPATPRPRDVVLVLDRSGSMGGWKVVAARRAAARIIDTLTAADRFAVLSFDHELEWPADLPQDLVSGTDRHRFRAIEHLAALSARGGTEMLRPLERAAALLRGADPAEKAAARDRVLVLVTDGQIGNEDQILERLAPRLAGVRVHTVGIDRAVNAGFLSRLAAAGQGRCELVESEDRLDVAMEHIHRRIGTPLVTGVELAADGIEPGTVAPSRPADLFPGAPLRIAGRWRGAAPTTMTVRGVAADGSRWEQRVDGVIDEHPATVAIWARTHLRELEDRYVSGNLAPAGRTSDAGSAVAEEFQSLDALEQRIVATSLRFGVLCRFTAFVAVDSRVVAGEEPAHRVVQPVELPDGWAQPAPASPGSFGAARPMSAVPAGPAAVPPPAAAPAPAAPAPSAAAGGAAFGGPVPDASVFDGPVLGKSARTRSLPGGGPPSPAAERAKKGAAPAGQPGEDPVVLAARRQVVHELDRLRAVAVPAESTGPGEELSPAQAAERRRFLADLGSRLHAAVAQLTDGSTGGPASAELAALRSLVADLRRCDGPDGPRGAELTELWQRALRVLAEFAGTGGTPTRPDRRAFWKRS